MWLGKLTLLAVSTAVALLGAELATRIVAPLHLVERRSLDGAPVPDWLTPGARYRQVSSEFDAPTAITPDGYRAPAVAGNPDLVFLGDSHTFGWGHADDATFAARYCASTARACANLGAPGTGTIQQVARLEEFLTRLAWRPREVWIFVFAMTTSFSRGNDLADDWWWAQWQRANAAHQAAPAASSPREAVERALQHQDVLLEHSNLARLVKLSWAPWLRSLLQPRLAAQRRDEALALTRGALARLDALGRARGFSYRIYLLHPIQDLMWGTWRETTAALASIAPAPIDDLGALLADDPQRFYYPLDGHLNDAGVEVITRHLLEGPP